MNAKATPKSVADARLDELATLGMRAARVVVRVLEIEQAVADAVAALLPEAGEPGSLGEAIAAGQGIDAAAAAMVLSVKRVEALTRAFDRVSRSVRRSVALMRRMEAGWPRAGSADDRAAMVRRQVVRAATEVIRRQSDGEAAERLFDDLAERLDDPGLDDELRSLPVAEVVRRVCADLGLAIAGVRDVLGEGAPGVGWVADTG